MSKIENETGINFHTFLKGLSTNALKYLINLAKQESIRRSQTRTFAEFENKALPKLKFNSHTILKIKENYYKIFSYTFSKFENGVLKPYNTTVVENAYVPDYIIDVEIYDWQKLVELKAPIVIKLKNVHDDSFFEIELHSRSKIFWFNKLLETSIQEPFERKFQLTGI